MRFKLFGFALTVCVLFISKQAWSQTYAESALQFSRTSPGGSARIQGLGSTQTALGGDYSSALSNPAGLGMYNRSELSLSTSLSFLKTRASYLGNSDEELKPSFTIPGFALVIHIPKENSSGFLGGSLALSFTRTNDFNQSVFYHGTTNDSNNPGSSIIDSFIDLANGDDSTQFDPGNYNYNTPTGLAYNNYLISPQSMIDSSNPHDQYYSDVQQDSYPDQQETIQTKGAINQWSFSYGGNFNDRFFFGFGLGLTSLNYKTSKIYTENFASDPELKSLSLEENLSVRGSGVNATVGITGRPIDFLQIGAAFTTPTVFQLSERYDAYLSTDWKNYDDEEAYTDVVTSTYSLTTPLKFSTGISLISKLGFISADLDIINQGQSKYNSSTDGLSFSGDNNEIKSNYKTAINYRIGAEYRYDIFRIRAGYGVQGNSYKNQFDADNTVRTISGGFGVRLKKFFVDFALVNSKGNNLYAPYLNAPIVQIKNSFTKGIVTAGVTF